MPKRRRQTRKRRQRAGARPKLEFDQIHWPEQFGCAEQALYETLEPNAYIDRFGGEKGFFVSPLNKYPYTYSQRSLPWLGNEAQQYRNNNDRRMKTREEIFRDEYEKKERRNLDDYHVYKVMKRIDNVESCPIAPAFNYPGGGHQYKLPRSIEALVASGHLVEIVDFPVIPTFK